MVRKYSRDMHLNPNGFYYSMFILGIAGIGLFVVNEEFIKWDTERNTKPISVYTRDVNSDGISDLVIEISNGKKFTFEGQEDGSYTRLEKVLGYD